MNGTKLYQLETLKIKEGVRLSDVFVGIYSIHIYIYIYISKGPERRVGRIKYGGGNLLDLLDHGGVRWDVLAGGSKHSFIFHPTWEDDPIWQICLEWVETTT